MTAAQVPPDRTLFVGPGMNGERHPPPRTSAAQQTSGKKENAPQPPLVFFLGRPADHHPRFFAVLPRQQQNPKSTADLLATGRKSKPDEESPTSFILRPTAHARRQAATHQFFVFGTDVGRKDRKMKYAPDVFQSGALTGVTPFRSFPLPVIRCCQQFRREASPRGAGRRRRFPCCAPRTSVRRCGLSGKRTSPGARVSVSAYNH